MEQKELNDLFERLVAEDTVSPSGDRLLALAVRLSGMQVASGLAMVAQHLGDIRDEMLNRRLTSSR